MFKPRPAQKTILTYRQGKMGVIAVPGSGKTWTLSKLASEIISRGDLGPDQEVLVVTLVNSAVENFSRRITKLIGEERIGLLPRFRVRTLHGLAHDIVRGRPDLLELSEDFQIIDEREADEIRDSVALAWLQANPYALDEYLEEDMADQRREWIRRDRLPDLVREVALAFIRYAKDQEITPAILQQTLEGIPLPLPLAEMGLAVYTDYQRALAYRGGVDFDDLIRLALRALVLDLDYLERLQERWPFILEDEAQDSSRLQEEILRTLAGPEGNWVRVGDPNQAIYESFTTANPRYLREFKDEAHFWEQLPNSGRSTVSIQSLANYLIEWTQSDHPVPAAQSALTPPRIQPTPPGDPQPNPEDHPDGVHLIDRKYTPQEELQAVARSVHRWVTDHPEDTVAVLVPRNFRGFQMVDLLRQRGLEPVDNLLRSTSSTRFTAGALGNLLNYLSDPGSAAKLALVYQVWHRGEREDEAAWARVERTSKLLRACRHVEDFLWPRHGSDWLAETGLEADEPETHARLLAFRERIQRWQGAVLLPVDQIILSLAQDLFTEPTDLAIAHKLAVVLRRASDAHEDWRLPELTEELAIVARNERRFLGFSEDDMGFDPDKYKGRVVVATAHKAKGLEWDRVYLLSVNNYNFPSGGAYDSYIAEKWFIRDDLNLAAEALAQLRSALSPDEYEWYREGLASREARLEYVRERLRLFYVGITRAKKDLVVTWNTGRRGDLQPALPLVALKAFWEDRQKPAET
jgi:DNA helicase-2/ATP-dependent DNA helicase PcrA